MEVLRRVGHCDFTVEGDGDHFSPISAPDTSMEAHLKWVSKLDAQPEAAAPEVKEDPSYQERKNEMKLYLESQGVETMLADAMRKLLKERPENARNFLLNFIQNYDSGPVKAEAPPASAQPNTQLVINGFYMSMRDCYTRPGACIHYFDVQWDAEKVSWHDFRKRILGATDPTAAEANSLRSIINADWKTLGLHSQPTIRDNGVHASASPFEALAERANWLQADIAADPLGKALTDAGVSLETLQEWTSDPQVEWHRQKTSLFDLLEDLDTSELIAKAARVVGAEVPTSNAAGPLPQNRAFVFVKPHACVSGGAIEELVRRKFADEGFSIVAEGSLDSKTIEERKLVDRHYGAIASKASLLQPAETHPPQAAKEQFGMKFNVSWEVAVEQGLVLNALDACKKLGIDGDEMARRWNEAKDNRHLLKFAGGFYCAQISAAPSTPISSDLYVINGFYMKMRDAYTLPGAKIHYFDVEWERDTLTWSDFRQLVLGATDPSIAAPGSLRCLIKEQWQALGLQESPTISNNGVHASASPFEAMVERANWLELSMESDPLSQALLAAGLSLDLQRDWSQDVQVPFEGKTTSIFDLLEDLDTWPLLGRAARIAGQPSIPDDAKASCPKNRAFVFVKPHAAVDAVVDLVREKLKAQSVEIKSEGSIGNEAIDEKKLIDKHYGAIAAKASLLTPAETNPSQKARENFGITFGASWEDAVASNKVYNAVDACKLLNINGSQMAAFWDGAKDRGELIKFGGGFYCAKIV